MSEIGTEEKTTRGLWIKWFEEAKPNSIEYTQSIDMAHKVFHILTLESMKISTMKSNRIVHTMA